jgi:hypothetical protein
LLRADVRRRASRRLPVTCASRNSAPNDVSQLRIALVDALAGLNRGLDFDPDAATEAPEEAAVEDLAEQLEDSNPSARPTRSPDMTGSWELIYSSSTLVRFTGGLTGLHKYLPEGTVGRICQILEPEDGKCSFTEQLSFVLPVVGKRVTVEAVAAGRLRTASDTRQVWEPQTIKASWYRSWAESWKSLRPFTNVDTTYLDRYIRITRGPTGSMNIFARTQDS